MAVPPDTPILPVILCGGGGSRLWPVSRASYPKQFQALAGPATLLQQTAARLSGPGYAAPCLVTAEGFRFIAAQQMADIGCAPQAILLEPAGRNTAPAVAAALAHLTALGHGPDALVLLSPADHHIPDTAAFRAAIAQARPQAEAGEAILFGAAPDRPEPAFGYIEHGPEDVTGAARPVHRFIEKPDTGTAARLITGGDHLWNVGLVLARLDRLTALIQRHAPDLWDGAAQAVTTGQRDLDFTRLAEGPWRALPSISFDRAVLEQAANLRVLPLGTGWSDLGTWAAVWALARESIPKDGEAGDVTLQGGATALECRDTWLRSDDPGMHVLGIGLDQIAVIATADGVLAIHRDHLDRVEAGVATLQAAGIRQGTHFRRTHRPWGWHDLLGEGASGGQSYEIRRLTIAPGAALSRQSHAFRSEHWIVLDGTITLERDDTQITLGPGQSSFVPQGKRHRLRNTTDAPATLIEVQSGTTIGEGDVERHPPGDGASP